ncbi:MAG TPA: metallophosphoesterase family protein [Planctomycetota bacterium]|nr:metallophosphoesterase family protein [Planctomycetota bacterium]
MIALISDIHSNTEALQAVYEDMEGKGVRQIYCLGDVIGYGPEPRETLELVRRCEFILLGNHEEGLLFSADDFNERARRALDWTRDQISSENHAKEDNYRLWEMVDGFKREHREGDYLFVHASPREPVREYVLPADALNRSKMSDIFEHMAQSRVSFGGHTHVPGVFVEGGSFHHQSALPEGRFRFGREKCLINVGSVGQPRDGDPRASYVLIDGDSVLFRRVEYDFKSTMRKIRGIAELDDFLARRLALGQ